MKNIYLSLLLLFLGIYACTDSADLLDPESTSSLTEEEVFLNAENAMLFLNGIYGQLMPVVPQTGNKGTRWGADALLEVTTDNGSTNIASTARPFLFNSGAWTPNSSTFSTDDWSRSWEAIRACNLFLSHVDDIPVDPEYNFDTAVREIRKGEAIFLKAFNYAEMAKQFGGLPLTDKAYAITDDLNEPRSTFDETLNYIVKLCEDAADLLPLEHPDYDYGRVTKGAALALKARMLTYAASPLWNNPQKPEDSPFRGKYDPQKWVEAARSSAEVINLNQYSLHNNISDLFITRTNPELIFIHVNQPCSYMTSISVPNKLYPAGAFGKSGCNQVTYNMIKEYEIIKDGKAYFIDDPNSEYDPNDPYQNRDPRFYRDCMFNGYKFQGKTVELGEAVTGATKTPSHNPVEESPYYTHVYSIKFADLDLVINFDARNPGAGASTNQNYPYIRYAEVLLNYAEAMNEAFGPEVDGLGNGKTSLWAVNEVRTRAKYPNRPEYMNLTGGMPPIESGLSKEAMREKIRHERRVEFSFEEHRFWDVRRWKIDPTTMTTIQAQVPVWQLDGTVKYEIRTIDNRYFDTKMYRMPIPEKELYTNPNLVQNPGYPLSTESE